MVTQTLRILKENAILNQVTCSEPGCGERMYRHAIAEHMLYDHDLQSPAGVRNQLAVIQAQREEIASLRSETTFLRTMNATAIVSTNVHVFNWSVASGYDGGTFSSPWHTFETGEKVRCVFKDSVGQDTLDGYFAGISQPLDQRTRFRFRVHFSILTPADVTYMTYADLGGEESFPHGQFHDFAGPTDNNYFGHDFDMSLVDKTATLRPDLSIRVRCKVTVLPLLQADPPAYVEIIEDN